MDVDLTLIVSISLSFLTLFILILFFAIIFRQEIKEFKDKPLLTNQKVQIQGTSDRKIDNNSDSSSSRTASTLTLEMSSPDEFGSREIIVKCREGRGSTKSKKLETSYANPSIDPSGVCEV